MVILAWSATCVIWSTVWLAIKIGVTDVPPFGFAALRLALAVLAPMTLSRRPSLIHADARLTASTDALLRRFFTASIGGTPRRPLAFLGVAFASTLGTATPENSAPS